MEDPVVNIPCDGEEVPIRRSVLEEIYFGILKSIQQEAFKTSRSARPMAAHGEMPQTGTRIAAHKKDLTLVEKQVALEKVRHAIRVRTAEFDLSELYTSARVTVKFRPERFWN